MKCETNPLQVVLIGAFPPPLHGVSFVNAEIQKSLLQSNITPFLINIAPHSLERKWYVRLSRITTIFLGLHTFLQVLMPGKKVNVYIGLSGGYGQIYESLFIILARIFRSRLFLHHHSYAYLNRKYLPSTILTNLAGSDATHIVLCQDMETQLRDKYKSVGNTFVLSNIVFTQVQSIQNDPNPCLKTIGFLSNISPAKGIFEFLDAIKQLEQEGIEYQALIAGPFQDEVIEKEVKERLSTINNAIYVGAKYGDEKLEFFKSLDLLLFPTKYANEAEPITIYEAMSFGIPVISFGRGCIGCTINPSVGLIVEQSADFTTSAVTQIKAWQSSPSSFQEIIANTLENFSQNHKNNQDKLIEILKLIADVA
jgi:glycosyltransferase involved in cell wall biosynthesis